MLNREFEEAKKQAEAKTCNCTALADERACFAWELENAGEDLRKFSISVKTEQTSTKVIQRRPQAIYAQSPFSGPPNIFELLFLPQGSTTTKILKQFKT